MFEWKKIDDIKYTTNFKNLTVEFEILDAEVEINIFYNERIIDATTAPYNEINIEHIKTIAENCLKAWANDKTEKWELYKIAMTINNQVKQSD